MPDELSIRRYEPDDAEAVWRVHEEALRASPVTFVEDAPGDADLLEVSEEYLDAGGEFLVGTTGGEVVAIGGYKPTDDSWGDDDGTDDTGTANDRTADGGGDERTADGRAAKGGTAELRRMRVHPDHQRKGYGEALLTRLETLADERGFDRLVLETNEHLAAARSLYETQGYGELDAERRHANGDRIVRYRKEL